MNTNVCFFMLNRSRFWYAAVTLISLHLVSCSPAPELDFFAEDVTIMIKDHAALVTGIYYFKNLTPDQLRVTFYYPFPVDSHHYFPESIWSFTEYQTDTSGITFTKLFRPAAIDSFKISYRQRFSGGFFRYITTTTSQWKRPIKHARFTIITPIHVFYEVNYKTQTEMITDQLHYRTVLCDNFLPEKDLIITRTSAP